ncbi:MAG: mechanosensitive ion channel family protein [Thermonemataceae bacterium]
MKYLLFFLLSLSLSTITFAQTDTLQEQTTQLDSLQLIQQDSIQRVNQAIADSIRKQVIILQAKADSIQRANRTVADSLFTNRVPVLLGKDTLFYVYGRYGELDKPARAKAVTQRLASLVDRYLFNTDSLKVVSDSVSTSIYYAREFVVSVTAEDSTALKQSKKTIATQYLKTIQQAIKAQRDQKTLKQRLIEVGLTILALLAVYLLYRLTNLFYRFVLKKIYENRKNLFKGFTYNNYEALTPQRQLEIAQYGLRVLRLVTHLLMLYFALPIIFSIFPATQGLADTLFSYVLDPIKKILRSILNYIPNLITIVIIYIATRYLVKLLKFIAQEIENEKLQLEGFYTDWAKPTYNIIRVLVYAFMFVVIFPYLPGSDSKIFQGVTVFIGVLFSLGSSAAVSNAVAGIVITYMRPFKIGQRVKIGDIIGDVVEKNLLVTRIRTIKNEEITIPNSSILSGHTVNYTSSAKYIIHSTITIGYDVPWKQVHALLIQAAEKTEGIMDDPAPFVLQTSLDDFYVSYQINAYTSYAKSIPETTSELHQYIQDGFNESGVEILSPHYRAVRDGGQVTIPTDYLPADYVQPSIKVSVESNKKEE